MTWLSWRQHRQQALFTFLGLAALAGLLLPTGRQMHAALAAHGLNDCLNAHGLADPGCSGLVHEFSERFRQLKLVAILLLFVPLLIGMFLGPPLVARELEHGTHRFVWTQGVTRLRWALVKIGLVGALAGTLAAGYALLLWWWMTPLNRINNSPLEPGLFDMQGLVPVGYTLFAVAVGILAGTLTRRVLSAMALTVFVFVAVRLVVALTVRPHFLPPLRVTLPVVDGEDPSQRRDWILSSSLYDGAGHQLQESALTVCAPGANACSEKFASGPLEGAYNVLVYQPIDRFWTFQTIETGLFVALAGLLIVLAVHRVRRYVS